MSAFDFCLAGVSADLKLGKSNVRILGTPTGASFVEPTGATLVPVEVATPTLDAQAANKGYVDSVANGLVWKYPVALCTAVALPANTQTGAGATLTADAVGAIPAIDGVAVTLNDRILVRSEGGGTDTKNGIYVAGDLGSGGTPWVLTRADDALVGEDAASNAMFCEQGATAADSAFVQTADSPVAYNADATTFTLFSSVVSGVTSVALDGGATGVSPIVNGAAPVPFFTGFTGESTVLTPTIVGQDIEYGLDDDGVTNAKLAPLVAVSCVTGQILHTDAGSNVLIGGATGIPVGAIVVSSTVQVTTAFTPNPVTADLKVAGVSRQGTDKSDLNIAGDYVCGDITSDVGQASVDVGVAAGLVAGVAECTFCYRRLT